MPRRVLLTTDAVGGVWRYVLELADGLAERGIEPVIAVVGPNPQPKQRAQASRIGRVIETGWPLDWTAENERALRKASRCLAQLARDEAVDLAHLHAPAFAGWDRWPVPVVAVAHSCLATWWNAVRGTALPADFRWRAGATARGLCQADAVIAPTAAFAEALGRVYALDRSITVVRNGRRAATPGANARQHAVLTAGRLWDEGKNVAALDRAAPLIDAPVYAAGSIVGPNGATARFDHLRLLGELDEPAVRARYAQAAIFAAPALYEPFGLSVLEAAQAGAALVLGEIPTLRELWDGAAIFVDPQDHVQLARVSRGLLGDQHAIRRAGALAQEKARAYTVSAMVDGTLAVHRATRARMAAVA